MLMQEWVVHKCFNLWSILEVFPSIGDTSRKTTPRLECIQCIDLLSATACLAVVPWHYRSPRNRKDELSNAIIAFFFKMEQLCWTSSEVAHGVARNTTRMLTDALWFLDGHQATFHDRSCDIPVVFDQFTIFNCPELSKYRKRCSVSLSSECGCVCCVCTFCACGCV